MLLIRSDRFCLDEETQYKKEGQEDSQRGDAADGLILSASYLETSHLHGCHLFPWLKWLRDATFLT